MGKLIKILNRASIDKDEDADADMDVDVGAFVVQVRTRITLIKVKDGARMPLRMQLCLSEVQGALSSVTHRSRQTLKPQEAQTSHKTPHQGTRVDMLGEGVLGLTINNPALYLLCSLPRCFKGRTATLCRRVKDRLIQHLHDIGSSKLHIRPSLSCIKLEKTQRHKSSIWTS